jgi:hypothetical protein
MPRMVNMVNPHAVVVMSSVRLAWLSGNNGGCGHGGHGDHVATIILIKIVASSYGVQH